MSQRIMINLLPHREMRRAQQKKDFQVRAVLAGVVGAVIVGLGGMYINGMIDSQKERNDYITGAIKKLDLEIAEIQTLESEIAALKARQKAVEDLQSDRTIPVHLFDELVKITPEGVYLNKLVQENLKVTFTGHAQSNERVAEFLRNLSEGTPWIEKPQLDEIKEIELKAPATPGAKSGATQTSRSIFEFQLNALLKRRSDVEGAKDGKDAATPAGGKPAAGKPGMTPVSTKAATNPGK